MSNMLKGKLVIKGEKGERGYSAYEIAVQNGFEGTEQEWVDLLQKHREDYESALEQLKEELSSAENGSAYVLKKDIVVIENYKQLDEKTIIMPLVPKTQGFIPDSESYVILWAYYENDSGDYLVKHPLTEADASIELRTGDTSSIYSNYGSDYVLITFKSTTLLNADNNFKVGLLKV